MKKILSLLFISLLIASCSAVKEKSLAGKKDKISEFSITKSLPNFRVENINDETIVDSRTIIDRKKANILIVITEWCPHCKKELPDIERFYTDYKDKVELTVIYSNDRTTKERVKIFDTSHNFSFKRYFDKYNEAYVTFAVKKYPSNYIIQNGTFVKIDNPVTYEKLVEIFSKIK